MNKKLITKSIIIFSVAGLAGFFLFGQIARANFFSDFINRMLPPASEKPVENKVVPYEATDAYESAMIKTVEEASQSVVSIVISKDLPVIEQCPYNPFGNLPPEYQQFFGDISGFTQPCQKGTKKQEVGGGTGFIISEDGMILTNKHVVSDEKAEYTVLMNDGKKYTAKILARDPLQDLAVAKIQATGLKPLKLGDSDSIKLGQTAIVIGNALGEFRNTVSRGIISGLSRKITATDGAQSESLEGLIQTDAAINPGNSGGPILNLRGEVIGVSVAMATNAQSIGFAIPINKAKRDINSVKASGKIIFPYLGVRYMAITDDLAEKEKLTVKRGALVRGNESGAGVLKDSPAYKAGIKAEDIILEVNGEKIDEDNSLSALLQKYNVGDKVKLKILRDSKEIEIEVALEEKK
ncbi:MAG: trypsin-like peptidase domain-containing protein [Candidatus Pacebacteria bacterium]|nr:trypsin-like peptidase domain-containing protein [Candidatus Paceibacterota bacterium]